VFQSCLNTEQLPVFYTSETSTVLLNAAGSYYCDIEGLNPILYIIYRTKALGNGYAGVKNALLLPMPSSNPGSEEAV
jgi:hypothetical protein